MKSILIFLRALVVAIAAILILTLIQFISQDVRNQNSWLRQELHEQRLWRKDYVEKNANYDSLLFCFHEISAISATKNEDFIRLLANYETIIEETLLLREDVVAQEFVIQRLQHRDSLYVKANAEWLIHCSELEYELQQYRSSQNQEVLLGLSENEVILDKSNRTSHQGFSIMLFASLAVILKTLHLLSKAFSSTRDKGP